MARNVGYILGLDEGSELLEKARDRWAGWVAADARLDVVADFDDLRGWLVAADPADADEVLVALAMLASPDGGDDIAAAGALAFCLLPGACRLAAWFATDRRHALRDLSEADELVASQLWIEVRSFRWRTGQKVAANILLATRAGVLNECGDTHQLARNDRAWLHTDLLCSFTNGEDQSSDAEGYGAGERRSAANGWRPGMLADPAPAPGEEIASPRDQLLEILEQACAENVISAKDRSILLCLVEEADRIDIRRTGRGGGGLMANDLSKRVGEQVGLSQQTVRRRTAKSMQALAASIPAGLSDDD